MRKLIGVLSLSLFLAGCGVAGLLPVVFSASQMDDLVGNMEETLEAQQLVSKWAIEAARGDLSLEGATYDPPTAGSNWLGTLTIDDGTFPFGAGDVVLQFTATGDGGPADPYVVDLSDDANVVLDIDVQFQGTGNSGLPLRVDADFVSEHTQNLEDEVTAKINGAFTVDYADYTSNFNATDLVTRIDIDEDRILDIVGDLQASVDVPDFPFDADFDLSGLGDAVQVSYDVFGSSLDYVLSLGSFLP